jgi:hypothetical protein
LRRIPLLRRICEPAGAARGRLPHPVCSWPRRNVHVGRSSTRAWGKVSCSHWVVASTNTYFPAFPGRNGGSYTGTVISALLLAGVLDPNCVPRHHAPPQPACRDPWPDPDLQDIKVADLPYSPVAAASPDLGHLPSVIWPGYVPNAVAHEPHGGVGVRAVVSVPEPSMLGLFAFSIAVLFALRRCSGRRSQSVSSRPRGRNRTQHSLQR